MDHGESVPLPDLPVQLWYKEPLSLCEPEAPCVQGCPNTDDGFTWDWFLHMIAQGDKCFSATAAACRRHCTVSVDNCMRQKVTLFLSSETFICCPLAPYGHTALTSQPRSSLAQIIEESSVSRVCVQNQNLPNHREKKNIYKNHHASRGRRPEQGLSGRSFFEISCFNSEINRNRSQPLTKDQKLKLKHTYNNFFFLNTVV